MEQLCSLLQTSAVGLVQLPNPIFIHILALNEHDRVWARQVCKAAKDAFPNTTAVPVRAPIPLWAFQWMWQHRTTPDTINKVVAGRAAAADLTALAWLRSINARSSTSSSDAAQLFGPAVCASAAGAGHIPVLQWLRCAVPELIARVLQNAVVNNHSTPQPQHSIASPQVGAVPAQAPVLCCKSCVLQATTLSNTSTARQWLMPKPLQ